MALMRRAIMMPGLALCVLGAANCGSAAKSARTSPDAGIANFSEVAPGVYRGGQPTKAGWAYLKSKGVKTIVKLNFTAEGSDEEAAALGMSVIDASVPPSDLGNVFAAPKPERIRLAVESLIDDRLRPVFVHCTHGQDRTGLVVGFYRVLHDHRTKEKAYEEMRENGFHRSLRGLREMWERFDGRIK